ncbi:hypothetical protein GCM10008932_00720 [Alkalibacterium iburiense]|uniref:Cation diffusion facilitator family transporter n=1 Tax=Alkalibacterium iburiense TaxID=290589 RepID=A0ABN0WZT1_9LACT
MDYQVKRVRSAEKGARISIAVYIVLAVSKIVVGFLLQSSSLSADGFNNFTDVVSSVTVLIGLKTARKPADHNHPYGHWKAEPIASLITSFVMLFVGFQVFLTSLTRLISGDIVQPSQSAAIVAVTGAIVLFFLYRYNLKLATKVNSSGLKAVSKDNLADSLTSLATAVAILAASLGWIWLDSLMAIIVSLIILKTGLDVFKESTFSLSDGFKTKKLAVYEEAIQTIPDVKAVPSIKARMYGANTYVDVTILVDGQMTVQEGHDITERIERKLYDEFDVLYTDVHVEPDNLKEQFNTQQM